MDALVNVAFPVFAIVLAGFLAARMGILGDESAVALNRFVYYFALPPLLFVFTARAPIAEIFYAPFLGVIFAGTGLTALAAMVVKRFLFPDGPAETGMAGFAAIFANAGYMGVPLFATAFGPEGTLPVIVVTLFGSIVSLGITMAALDIIGAGPNSPAAAFRQVIGGMVRNPLVVAPILGIAASALALPIPKPVGNFLDLMAAASGPAALFALGLSLNGQKLVGDMVEVGWLTGFKLVVHPAVTWLLGAFVFRMDPFWFKSAVLISALPTGALVFVVAQQYDVYVRRASSIIVVTTALSVATVSLVLVWLGIG